MGALGSALHHQKGKDFEQPLNCHIEGTVCNLHADFHGTPGPDRIRNKELIDISGVGSYSWSVPSLVRYMHDNYLVGG